ncbi:hypothetical protein U1Q18_044151 [Sarracenia purpurea var. burkii]
MADREGRCVGARISTPNATIRSPFPRISPPLRRRCRRLHTLPLRHRTLGSGLIDQIYSDAGAIFIYITIFAPSPSIISTETKCRASRWPWLLQQISNKPPPQPQKPNPTATNSAAPTTSKRRLGA